MGQGMGLMAGQVDTDTNPNGFDARAVKFIQARLTGKLRDVPTNSLFFVVKKDDPTNSAE